MKSVCKCCGSKAGLRTIYEGSIRDGKFKSYKNNQVVLECETCGARFLSESHNVNYDTDEYRSLVQDKFNEEHYYKEHDKEQLYNLEVLDNENVRGKVVADIGCAAGAFLDNVRGLASDVIAVEPFKYYQEVLKKKGYKVFGYVNDIDENLKVDIATSFAVIEHLDDPIQFVSDIKKIVKKGGIIILSTPNSNDFQLDLIGKEYKEFYYRTVHPFYFNEKSFRYIADVLGFQSIEFIYKHKYDLSNLIYWLKDRNPTGLGKINIFEELDFNFRKILEREKISNFMYVKFTV